METSSKAVNRAGTVSTKTLCEGMSGSAQKEPVCKSDLIIQSRPDLANAFKTFDLGRAANSVVQNCSTSANRPPLAQASLSNLGLVIAFIAALGIGSIIAAMIARWNSISQLRQAWIDALRREISDFFHCVEKVGAAASAHDQETKNKQRERRDEAMAAYRQIVLRLNFKEIDHRRLDHALKNALVVNSTIDDGKMTSCLVLSRKVLKKEWDRTKFGPLVNAVYSWKRYTRKRKLKRFAAARRRRQ